MEHTYSAPLVVIAGLDPAIHSVASTRIFCISEWMPGSSPGMTTWMNLRSDERHTRLYQAAQEAPSDG
jgi:hypothetical protein